METKEEKKEELLTLEDMLESVQNALGEKTPPSIKIKDREGNESISREMLNEITKQLTGKLPSEETGGLPINPQKALERFLKETDGEDIYSESSRLSDVLLDSPQAIRRQESRHIEEQNKQEDPYRDISQTKLLEYQEFRKNRMQKAKDFVLKGYRTQTLHTEKPLYDKPAPEHPEKERENEQEVFAREPEPADYLERRAKEDDSKIRTYLVTFKSSCFRALLAIGFLSAASIAVDILYRKDYFSFHPVVLTVLFALAILAGGILSRDILKTGLLGFIHLKGNRDSLPALALLGSGVQTLLLLFSEKEMVGNSSVFYLAPIALTILFFHHMGRYVLVKRALSNLRFLESPSSVFGSGTMQNEELAADFTKGVLYDKPYVGFNRKSSFITDFIYHSFLEDMTDRIGLFLSPIALLASLVLFAIYLSISENIWESATLFAAGLAVFSPFGLSFSVQLPLFFASKKAKSDQTTILGFNAAEEFGQLNAAITTARDLFPKGSVNLQGMRAFHHHPIDESILSAASMLYATNSILRDMFMQVLLNRKDVLKPVDSILLEDGLGISGWVNNQHVIIGTREMAINHNIEMPPIEEEKRLCPDGYKIVYLCISGELAAAFVFGLSADPLTRESILRLAENEVFLVVQTVDPAISSQTLSEVFHISPEEFKILPARFNAAYQKQTDPAETLSSPVINSGSFPSYSKGILSAKKLSSTFLLNSVLLLLSMGLGFFVLAACSFMGTLHPLTPLFILAYQLLGCIVIGGVSYARNK